MGPSAAHEAQRSTLLWLASVAPKQGLVPALPHHPVLLNASTPRPPPPSEPRCRPRDQSARQPDARGGPPPPSSDGSRNVVDGSPGRLVPSVPKPPAPSPEATSQGPLPNRLVRVGCRVAISKPAANRGGLLASCFDLSACEIPPWPASKYLRC